MVAAGYSNSDIRKQLNVSERRLYRRLTEAVDSDWQKLKEKDDSDKLALQISLLENRLTASYRRLVAIATSPRPLQGGRLKPSALLLTAQWQYCKLLLLDP
jgi:hypothetical protein